MLTQLEEGKIFLEDEDAHIQLDLSSVVSLDILRNKKNVDLYVFFI